MRNLVLTLSLLLLVSINPRCIKNSACTPKSPASEVSQIEGYAMAKGINAVADPSGLYYEIIDPGSGTSANANSSIIITYRGEMLDGTLFDERTTPNTSPWALSDLIEGWKVGIPLIKKGGHIKLIVPSAMAYGCLGKGIIPGNSVLFFDINLIDIR